MGGGGGRGVQKVSGKGPKLPNIFYNTPPFLRKFIKSCRELQNKIDIDNYSTAFVKEIPLSYPLIKVGKHKNIRKLILIQIRFFVFSSRMRVKLCIQVLPASCCVAQNRFKPCPPG